MSYMKRKFKDMQSIARAVQKHAGNMKLVSQKCDIPYSTIRKAIQQSKARERIVRFRREIPGSLFQFDLSRSRHLILHKDGTIEAANTNAKGYYRDKEGSLVRLWIGAIVDDATSNLRFQYFILRGGESFINLISILYALLSCEFVEMPLPCGLPRQILIDRSSGFKSGNFVEKLKGTVEVIQSQQARTKGKVERAFRTIKSTFEADLLGSNWKGTIDELNRLALRFSVAFNKAKDRHFLPAHVRDPRLLLSALLDIREKQVDRGVLEVDGSFYYLPEGFGEKRVRYFVHEGEVFAILKNSIVKLSPSGGVASIVQGEALPDAPLWSERFYREDRTIFIKPPAFGDEERGEEEEFLTGGDWL